MKNLSVESKELLDSGIAHHQNGHFAEAEICYQEVLKGQPDHADAWHLLGVIAYERGEYELAIEQIRRSIAIKPNTANFYNSLAVVYSKQHDFVNAIECYEQTLRLKPDFLNPYQNLGQLYRTQRNFVKAEAAYRKALVIKTDDFGALTGLGHLLKETGQNTAAEAAYRKALEIKPDDSQIHFQLGDLFMSQKRLLEATACYKQVLSVQEDFPYAFGMASHCYAKLCDWSHYRETRERLSVSVQKGVKSVTPFIFLNFSDDPGIQRNCATIWRHDFSVSNVKVPRYRHNKIRLAYVSADFKQHPVAYLIADLIEAHDRTQFEVIAVSIAPPSKDEWHIRLKQGFDQFLEVHTLSDEAVIDLLRELEIDIAVDLAGYTSAHSRTDLFARRLAPIQVSYLGFPGTMGADFMDYLIADRFVIPQVQQSAYAEKIVYLPDIFQSVSRRQEAETLPGRSTLGLPEERIVFCCFNNSYKIHPPVFDVWMRLLHQVKNSVLWLSKFDDAMENNLRREAQTRGINPERLVFALPRPLPQYLASYRHADLFLDTFSFNAGATASDALWAGLPLITCVGKSFASRMGGSLLQAAGLSELITENLLEYETRALFFATHPDDLSALKQKLLRHHLTHPLFDLDRFRRHIEAAYLTMWQIWQRGDAPRAFAIEPIEAPPGCR